MTPYMARIVTGLTLSIFLGYCAFWAMALAECDAWPSNDMERVIRAAQQISVKGECNGSAHTG